jgi:hypothetical protein
VGKIAEHHLSRYPNRQCSVDSIKQKFKELYSKKIPTGDPNCPQEVRCAKWLRRQIINSMNASDLNSEEEFSGSDDGDCDSSSCGNSQDYDNIRDVIDLHGPPKNDEAEDNDMSAFLDDDAGFSDAPPTGGGEGEAVAHHPVSRSSSSRAVDVPEGRAPRPPSRATGSIASSSSRAVDGSIASSASGSPRGRGRLPTRDQSNRRHSRTHLTPISRPRN